MMNHASRNIPLLRGMHGNCKRAHLPIVRLHRLLEFIQKFQGSHTCQVVTLHRNHAARFICVLWPGYHFERSEVSWLTDTTVTDLREPRQNHLSRLMTCDCRIVSCLASLLTRKAGLKVVPEESSHVHNDARMEALCEIPLRLLHELPNEQHRRSGAIPAPHTSSAQCNGRALCCNSHPRPYDAFSSFQGRSACA